MKSLLALPRRLYPLGEVILQSGITGPSQGSENIGLSCRQKPAIKAVVFDVFGTLVRITERRRPYRRLQDLLLQHGRCRTQEDATTFMTVDLDFSEVPAYFGCPLPVESLAPLREDLDAELRSISLFADVEAVISVLKKSGCKLALCSNLAKPYAAPVRGLLPGLDVYMWSFEAGAVKPDPRIYDRLCSTLGCKPGSVLMVGDTLEADCDGPIAFGMRALHLNRDGHSAGSVSNLHEVLNYLACELGPAGLVLDEPRDPGAT